jgi:predicted nucleotidyltransferase
MSTYDVSMVTELGPIADVLREIDTVMSELGRSWMLVGAVARDILLHHIAGLEPERLTHDVDVAVAVANWRDYGSLARHLGGHRGPMHRFVVCGLPVAVVPFGEIVWPDDHAMNVAGFREAYKSSDTVLLPDELVIRIPSLAALALLKLSAWADRRSISTKDAVDLRQILNTYGQAHFVEYLFNAGTDLMERHDFDPALAGAGLLGREVRALLGQDAIDVVLVAMDRERCEDLARDMRGSVAENRARLAAFLSEIADPPNAL